jgi:hypothetical protein
MLFLLRLNYVLKEIGKRKRQVEQFPIATRPAAVCTRPAHEFASLVLENGIARYADDRSGQILTELSLSMVVFPRHETFLK